EDLWPFNEEVLAEAIYASRIPVVSGVGHEDDLTISDLVADLRALTPSDAALRVTPDRAELLQGLAACAGRLQALMKQRLGVARARLEDRGQRRCFRQPLQRVREHEQRLDDRVARLERAGRQMLAQARQRLAAQSGRLESLSPLNVLGRGYSVTRKPGDA